MLSNAQSPRRVRLTFVVNAPRALVVLIPMVGVGTASCTFDADSNQSHNKYDAQAAGRAAGMGGSSTMEIAGSNANGGSAGGSELSAGAGVAGIGVANGEAGLSGAGNAGGDEGTAGLMGIAGGSAETAGGGKANSDVNGGTAGLGSNGQEYGGTTAGEGGNGGTTSAAGAGGSVGLVCQVGRQVCDGECVNAQSNAHACGTSCVDCDDEPTGRGSACSDGECICKQGAQPKTCGTACVDLAVDPMNCGDCGKVCGPAEVCSGGKCALTCGGTTPQLCNGGCFDAKTDAHACGTSCVDCDDEPTGRGSACSDGECICKQGAQPKTCGTACVDLAVDPMNCGDCGKVCGPAEVCSGGKCGLTCGGTTPQLCNGGCVDAKTDEHACGTSCVDCDGPAGRGSVCIDAECICNKGAQPKTCGTACVDLAVDPMNCGDCGKVCGPAEVCSGGKCGLTCGGTTPQLCNGGCVDAKTDEHACGTSCVDCDGPAGRGSVCIDAECICNKGAQPKTCGTVCVDLAVDWLNCGSCGNVCKTGEVCSDGTCQLQCGGTTPRLCSGGCVNAQSNALACGTTCANCEATTGKGSVCLDGTCTCNLGATPKTCGTACVDLAVDRLNCGSCGNACKTGEVCSDGACQLQCGGTTPTLCNGGCVNAQNNAQACGTTCANCEATTGKGSLCLDGTCACNLGAMPKTCGTACVDLAVDRRNCGSCGNACKTGEVCSGGSCQLQCGGTTPRLCSGGCVDAQTNAHACGTSCTDCDGVTGVGSGCLNGTCTCSVGASPRTCGTACVDLAVDRLNCGGCGNACKVGEVCSGGVCQLQCGGTTPQFCNGGCVNAQSNAQACGTTCANCEATTGKGSVCLDGTCTCNVGASPRTCGTACVDLAVDRLNCGSCGNACKSGEVCSGGTCQLQCGGTTPQLCNGGCVNAQANAQACGPTCANCEATTGKGSVCVNGTCTCSAGASPKTCATVCVDLTVDPQNCGDCGIVCGADLFCSAGRCTRGCTPEETTCGRSCVVLDTNRENCGACGYACAPGQVCAERTCRCPEGRLWCNTGCVDVQTDPGNCGACGTMCNAAQVCLGGGCVERIPCGSRAEICNGQDDNCDNNRDETFLGAPFHLGEACTVGIGECKNTGIMQCAAGGLSTACNVAALPPKSEECNDKDDDCDGIVDYELVDGRPQSVCVCNDPALEFATAEPCNAPGCTIPQCGLSEDGSQLTMNYQLGPCAYPYPWAQCIYRSMSLNRFDPDHGGTGILEVALCITGSPSSNRLSGLNLYFGTYPNRKMLRFFSETELDAGIFSGCYRRYFEPTDLECVVVVDPRLPSSCQTGCVNGLWSSPNRPECIFNYDNVPLWLTAERCRDSGVGASITGFTVRYLTGPACVCLNSSQCRATGRPICDTTDPVSSDRCSPGTRCSGVCVPE